MDGQIQTDFVNIFIWPYRLVVSSVAVAHQFIMFKIFVGSLMIFLKFLEKYFFIFHEYVLCFSNRNLVN